MTLLAWRTQTRPVVRTRSGLALSPNEERYVLSNVSAPEVFGNPWAFTLRGRLDRARLTEAIVGMCDRHETRRTGFEPGPDGRFTRYVEQHARPDIRWLSRPGASDDEVRRIIRAWFYERGDLTPPSLNRYLVIRLARDRHVLANFLEHTVVDGETHRASFDEIFARYAGRPPEGPVTPYSDLWAHDWRATPAYREAAGFWAQRLRGVEAVGELAPDGGDPPGGEVTGPVRQPIPAALAAQARAAAQAAGVSEFAFYYAVTLVLLTRLTGERRICSTFQSSGRRLSPGSEGVQGVFSNGLVLATPVDEAEPIAALAQRLRGEIREALAHEACPYHHIIQLTGLRPRFGVNWYPDLPHWEAPGLSISRPAMDFGNWEYDLNIRYIRDAETEGVDVIFYFRETAISRARAVAAAAQFAGLLAAFSEDVSRPIASVPSGALAPAGRLPGPAAPLPADAGELITAAFLRQAAARPDAAAIAHVGGVLTYGALEARTRTLAAALHAAGVGRGDRVGIVAERGPEVVCGLLAASRLGAVFVVLDSAYPASRLAALIGIAAPRALLPAGGAAAADLAQALSAATGTPVVDPTEAASTPAALDQVDPADPAYILFTSGSTGEPKGVACAHGPLSRFVAWQAQTYGLGAADRFSMLSGLSHDPLLRDIFTPLSLGATLAIPPAAALSEPDRLARWFRQTRVSVTHLTPAHGQVLAVGAEHVRLPALRHMFWGGDLLPPALSDAFRALVPAARQTNFYGATETPQAVAAFDCDGSGPRRVTPIGRGVNGAQLLILDTAGRLAGGGEMGEIAVRSNHLSLGYVAAGRVVPPQTPDLYRTGDRGFYLPDGQVLLLGRADDQVKVRGHRVEPAEIAAALRLHPAVADAEVVAVGAAGDLWIAGFVVAGPRRRVTEAELANFLSARLPAAMRPRRVLVVDALPLLPNGKVDRRALATLAQAAGTPEADAGAGSAGSLEAALAARWREVLGQAAIGAGSTFAALGGDSLSYVQAYLATQAVLGEVPPGWHLMTVRELAARGRRMRRGWSVVDTPMLVRAASIVLIVAGHFHLAHYGGGATSGLLVVSGFLLGSFQFREAVDQDSAVPLFKALRRLLLPTALFSAALFAGKALAGKHPDLSILLLYGDFVDYSKQDPTNYGGNELYLWFIYSLVHMLALLAVAVAALQALGALRMGRARVVIGLFLVGCVTRFVLPIAFVPGFLAHGAPRMAMVRFLPTTHLATLMLGALIALVSNDRQRLMALGVLSAYAGLTAWFYGVPNGYAVLTGALLILATPRLPAPRALVAVILALSGASLFIYLTHFLVRSGLRWAHAPNWPALHVAVALVVGVGLWTLWIRGASWVAAWRRRTQPQEAPALV